MRNKIYYSDKYSQLFDYKERRRIAKQLLLVLSLRIENRKIMSCLDLACSAGIMTEYFSRYFKKVVGIDIDNNALNFARQKFVRHNLRFSRMDANHMNFRKESFDVVICNQVYQFLDNPKEMVKEVYRVLKPNGVFLITGPNIFSFYEAQTRLPLLHFLPLSTAKKLARLFGKQYHPAHYLNLFEMRKMLKDFIILDATPVVIKNPSRFGFKNLIKFEGITGKLPLFILKYISVFSPNFIFICQKP